MSIAAMNWAMNQRTGAPSGQCVLYVLADVADPEGICFPSVGYIAERSQQSRDTVRRRLKEMEEAGLLVRFQRHEKTGRQKSDEIRLILGDAAVSMADPDMPENMAENSGQTGAIAPGGEGRNLRGGEGSTRARGGVAMVPPHEPPLNQEKQPQSPFKGAVGLSDQDLEKRVEAFENAYPCPTTRRSLLLSLIAALTGPEYETLISAAAGYAVHCAREKRRHMDPVKFVRSADNWPGFAKLAPRPPPDRVFVEAGSRAFAAWAVHGEIVSPDAHPPRLFVGPGSQRGAWMATALPPGGEALADFAGEDGAPDMALWHEIEFGTKNWWAWSERVARWTGAALEADVFIKDGEGEMTTVNGREIFMPHKISGRRLPGEWPPKVAKPDEAETAGMEDAAAHG